MSINPLAIATAVSAVSYTASVALSDGGFTNWDWGQFGTQVAIGAASGAVTFGIGTGFDQLATGLSGSKLALVKIGKIATHAAFQGGVSTAQGGDFWSAFGAGIAGGAVGQLTDGLDLQGFGGNAATIGSSML